MYLGEKFIGFIFVCTKNNTSLSSLMTADLIELTERFSTIYNTYCQREELYYKAHFDSLTKLSNRGHLLENLKQRWSHAINHRSILTLFYIDLDNFKSVNDLSGHHAGNRVLIQVATRLSDCVDNQSLIARLSGDEFCILYDHTIPDKSVKDIAASIISCLRKPFIVDDMTFFLGASVGVATGPEQCGSPGLLIERADLAMYKAKQEGKNNYVIYNREIEKQRNYRLSLEHHLHYALERKEIYLNYQPKIDLQSGKMTSVESLARWHQGELGLIPTDQFISLAEESGMIADIGRWILKKACYQFVDWLDRGVQLESIAVNVSPRQLALRNFSETVASAVKETGIPAHCLDLEVTESAFINDEFLLNDELSKLHSLGVKISIDDFGKEYSSLSYLKKIPFDTLKIDREFIIDLETDHRDQHIIDVIINIGHTLNKKIVAEGIETVNQRNLLKKYGCDVGQGYLFSCPLTDIEFLEFATHYRDQGMSTETLQALSS